MLRVRKGYIYFNLLLIDLIVLFLIFSYYDNWNKFNLVIYISITQVRLKQYFMLNILNHDLCVIPLKTDKKKLFEIFIKYLEIYNDIYSVINYQNRKFCNLVWKYLKIIDLKEHGNKWVKE